MALATVIYKHCYTNTSMTLREPNYAVPSALAERASSSIAAQSPACTSERGVSQLPPTHTTFGNAR